jgi:cytoskeleton protein RodZ
MTNANQNAFGSRLQAAREALNLDTKEAARQLRLNEKVILMLEENQCASHIPTTFLRGYIRSYAKYLQIPEQEAQAALDALQPSAPAPTIIAPALPTKTVNSGHYFMRGFTTLIVITMVALVGTWWHTHSRSPAAVSVVTENQQPIPIVDNAPQQLAAASTPPYAAAAAITPQTTGNAIATSAPSVAPAKPTHEADNYASEKLIEDDSEGDEGG